MLRTVRTALLLAPIALAGLAAPPGARAGYEEELLVLINAYRTENTLPPLKGDQRCERLAREHSQSMQQAQRLSHDGFKERFSRADSRGCVENVGWNHKTPASQFSGWKKSPDHNRNMLAPDIVRAGIAKAGTYVTFFACK